MRLIISAAPDDPYPISCADDLEEAIRDEATTVASDAGSDLLDDPGEDARDELRDAIIREATASLGSLDMIPARGSSYRDPNGVRWTLVLDPEDKD